MKHCRLLADAASGTSELETIGQRAFHIVRSSSISNTVFAISVPPRVLGFTVKVQSSRLGIRGLRASPTCGSKGEPGSANLFSGVLKGVRLVAGVCSKHSLGES